MSKKKKISSVVHDVKFSKTLIVVLIIDIFLGSDQIARSTHVLYHRLILYIKYITEKHIFASEILVL